MQPTYVLRHGQTDWNAEYRLQGQAETDINLRGRAQARRNGEMLARLIPDPADYAFIASPLRRTRQTMELVRDAMGLPREGYRLDPRLVELHFGDWQGRAYSEVEASDPQSAAARARDKWNFRPPGVEAESYAMLAERVRPWLSGLAGPAVVVTHGGVVRALFYLIEGMNEVDAANLEVPQDRVLRLGEGRLEWI
jgi:broad specificity phosphatase PhoE